MPFCFCIEKHLKKEVNNFWYHNCASTAAHSSEKCNTRMFLNNYFKIVPPFQQKRLILLPTAILIFHVKVLTERVGVLLMALSGLYIDSYREFNKTFTERSVWFLMVWSDCASIAAKLCEDFNTRVLLNIYFKVPLFFFPHDNICQFASW